MAPEPTQPKNWRGLASVSGAFAGAGMAEGARQSVRVEHVSIGRLAILIACALVGGATVGYRIANRKSKSDC